MSTTIKNLSLSIGDALSSGFNIELNDVVYRLDSFRFHQSLLDHNTLSFKMHKGPEEDMHEVMFSICGEIIGKEISMVLQTENFENISLLNENHDNVANI